MPDTPENSPPEGPNQEPTADKPIDPRPEQVETPAPLPHTEDNAALRHDPPTGPGDHLAPPGMAGTKHLAPQQPSPQEPKAETIDPAVAAFLENREKAKADLRAWLGGGPARVEPTFPKIDYNEAAKNKPKT